MGELGVLTWKLTDHHRTIPNKQTAKKKGQEEQNNRQKKASIVIGTSGLGGLGPKIDITDKYIQTENRVV